MTKLLAQELGKSNPEVNLKVSDVERLKEKFSCCAEDELDYEKLLHNSRKEQHTLPDGQVLFSDLPRGIIFLVIDLSSTFFLWFSYCLIPYPPFTDLPISFIVYFLLLAFISTCLLVHYC